MFPQRLCSSSPRRAGVLRFRSSSRPASHSLAPLAGRGWGEGASPRGSELRRSESRRGPLLHPHAEEHCAAMRLEACGSASFETRCALLRMRSWKSRSRDAVRTRVIVTRRKFLRSPHRSSPENAGGGHRNLTICALSHECKKEEKGKRNADRRGSVSTALACGARFAKRARQSAFHHGSDLRDYSSQRLTSGQAS